MPLRLLTRLFTNIDGRAASRFIAALVPLLTFTTQPFARTNDEHERVAAALVA